MSDISMKCDWSKNAEPKFLSEQENLVIFLKDGFSFFRANAELLTRRLADPTKQTTIIIAHPDSPHMVAIADMDTLKAGKPEVQKSDCMQAVGILHKIRETLIADGKGDCAERVAFIGHDLVPTWNGFIGDERIVYTLYPTRPYRGPLVSFDGYKGNCGKAAFLYDAAALDCAEIIREAAKKPSSNLWTHAL